MLKKLLFIVLLTLLLGYLLSPNSFCQQCGSEGEPCSEDGALGTCCLTYTDAEGICWKLKCSTDPNTENTCIKDGQCSEK